MPRIVVLPSAILALSLLAGNATFGPQSLAAQQGGTMEKDSAGMAKKGTMEMKAMEHKMGGMESGKMMGDSGMAMHANMMFMGAKGQEAAGDYEVTSTDGKSTLILTDHFSVTAAPDLYLVLSNGSTPSDGSLYLTKLKQTHGAQRYALPKGKDLAGYTTLLVWSKKENRAVASAEWHPSSDAMMGDHKMKEKM
jgi:electron transfer DM13